MDQRAQPGEKRSNMLDQLKTLLNERDVARAVGMSLGTVRRWRLLRQGPKFLKIGASVRYRPSDLAEWLEARPSGGSTGGAL